MIRTLWRRLRRTDALEAAAQELKEAEAALARAADPELIRMDVEGGKFNAAFKHGTIVLMLAEQFHGIMKEHGADNVLEVSVRHPRDPEVDIMVTLQKKPAKTPMDLVQDARRERDEAQGKLAEIGRILGVNP